MYSNKFDCQIKNWIFRKKRTQSYLATNHKCIRINSPVRYNLNFQKRTQSYLPHWETTNVFGEIRLSPIICAISIYGYISSNPTPATNSKEVSIFLFNFNELILHKRKVNNTIWGVYLDHKILLCFHFQQSSCPGIMGQPLFGNVRNHFEEWSWTLRLIFLKLNFFKFSGI